MDAPVTINVIEYLLHNYQYKDAIFLAERLYDNDKSLSSGYTLANCYYRNGLIQQARFLSSKYVNECSKCALLFARCCYSLRQYHEGLTHLQGLLQCSGSIDYNIVKARFGNDVGVAFCLLGDFNKKLYFNEEASKMYNLALEYNPFLWSAFESLCQMGKATQSIEEYFNTDKAPLDAILNTKNSESIIVPPTLKQNEPVLSTIKSSSLDSSFIGTELFKSGSAVTPAMCQQQSTRVGGARPPLLSFDNSKGFGALSFTDTPAAVLNFSSSTPQLSSTVAKYDKPRSNLPTSSLGCVTSDASCNLKQLETADSITPSQQKSSEEESSVFTTTTPISSLTTPTTTLQDFSIPNQSRVIAAPTSSINPRRSARLGGGGGIGKSPSSMSISRHRAEIISSPLTQSRVKARMKNIKSPRLKKKAVKFVGKDKRISPQRPRPLSPKDPQENADPRIQQTKETKSDEDKMEVTTPVTASDKETMSKEEKLRKSLDSIVNVLSSFGMGYKQLLNYKLDEALECIQSLPPQYKNSCWALTQLGQAMVAKENFKKASKYFSRVHSIDPHRQEGMDMYGAALWHLQQEHDLSSLVEDLQSSDKTRPEGLCAMSSLMNLYKEHEAAILYLERAIQIDPDYVYAQTLLGLEHILIKDYDKALTAFQSATAINPRHFNSWYGLGHLYLKQEKLAMAEISSRRALSINPFSSVAYTQLAMILQHQGKLKPALVKVEHAITLNAANSLPKYHRALILESLEQYQDALSQLESLTSVSPREPVFYKTMSRILMKLKRPHEAVVHMSWALDYTHSTRCMMGGGGVTNMEGGGTLEHMIEALPGINERDFEVHSDNDDFEDDS